MDYYPQILDMADFYMLNTVCVIAHQLLAGQVPKQKETTYWWLVYNSSVIMWLRQQQNYEVVYSGGTRCQGLVV